MTVYKIKSRGTDEKGTTIERTEYIDNSRNSVFFGDDTSEKVKRKFNHFWRGVAAVTEIKPVNVKSKGMNWGIKMRKLRRMV